MKKLKKQLLHVVSFLIVASAVYSFTNPQSATNSIDIFEAIKLGKITMVAKNNGGYSLESVNLSLKNNTATTLSISIPAGAVFKPADEGDQDLIVPIEDVLVLQPKAQLQRNINAYCIQASERSPNENGSTSLSKNLNTNLGKLLTYFKTNKVDKSDIQDALWAVSDGHSICNVGNTSEQGKNLRTFLATLTGQENTWYHTPQSRVIEEDRTIQRETVTVSGQLSYTVPKGTIVFDEVVSADGRSFFKSQGKVAPYGGKVEFSFNLRVKGWKKGDYFVKVMKGSEQIVVFPFSIT
ncbi:MAG: hypothetical protein V4638_02075 [Bacteroidota bacterium]